jgi:hypothetical protein
MVLTKLGLFAWGAAGLDGELGDERGFALMASSSAVSILSAVKAKCTSGAEKFLADRLPRTVVLPSDAASPVIETVFCENCALAELTASGFASSGVVIVAFEMLARPE